eukprot:TRINITY_DN5043_c0_g1_i8.p1 TRINITY_DN5043_c0_g1~~TRINITY_DN5043_c0_g1_i8.p1  ORF type:complete len:430 (+),score=67.96 TRINITY_DN5043_c0_g1_i8:72-1361(+)
MAYFGRRLLSRHLAPLPHAIVAGSVALGAGPSAFAEPKKKGCCQKENKKENQKDQEQARAYWQEQKSEIPPHMNPMFKEELGGALTHTGLASETRRRLASEAQYPLEKAMMTLAPQVPPPIKRKYPAHVVADLVVQDKAIKVSGNTKYTYWPFGFKDEKTGEIKVGVPGPMIRVRAGDVLQVNFTNLDSSGMAHNIDFHCVHGPGGGAPCLYAEQDETKTGVFQINEPGLYFYHCAAAPVPVHINNGMFGLVLVEPTEGLPLVDKEFYVVQHELYATEDDETGDYETDYDGAANEIPKHVFFNGKETALVDKPLMVNQGERVRMFFGNAGPNLISSFHVIGAIFDKVYREGDLISPPGRHIATTAVSTCGATMLEFNLHVPGTYTLVDHSINRIDKGAVGMMKCKGKPRPDIYDSREIPVQCEGCKLHQ